MQSSEFTPTPRFDDQPELGDIKINHTVVASIVRLAALQIPGVAGVGGGIVDGISELFAKRRESDHRGVKVNETDDDTYTIELRIVINYGSEIGKTAYEVQLAVRKQVIAMTGKNVAKVDVIIEGVRLPGDLNAAQDKSDDLWPDAPATD
ncbi:Asp23/Gls24 family envelope stress response protein [Rariglobus hedericola]|uniref:Asp23/Gls24 family envelope stress response protein n=1 Tax=Rariglobus hedericola TaxID=2597822 RepID=A0A556QK46_9BACT|nr:Asp23/Gls24 family envelope stress response protein [Rariglobus hedericola]TSJ76997.1 Asp23/Gls24 family envelope stress response protein [Rariglobus hedericola]